MDPSVTVDNVTLPEGNNWRKSYFHYFSGLLKKRVKDC
jgi:hypothetical protein